MKQQTALIAGATGFIGRYIVNERSFLILTKWVRMKIDK